MRRRRSPPASASAIATAPIPAPAPMPAELQSRPEAGASRTAREPVGSGFAGHAGGAALCAVASPSPRSCVRTNMLAFLVFEFVDLPAYKPLGWLFVSAATAPAGAAIRPR